MNESGSDVSDEGVSFLCGLDDLAATGCKDLETFFARSICITKVGILVPMNHFKLLKYADRKKLIKAKAEMKEGSNVLPPTRILKSLSFLANEFVDLNYDAVNFPFNENDAQPLALAT